jgi:hypothetical protein
MIPPCPNQEQLLYAESLKREAVRFAEWLLIHCDSIYYDGDSYFDLRSDLDNVYSPSQLYDKFKEDGE